MSKIDHFLAHGNEAQLLLEGQREQAIEMAAEMKEHEKASPARRSPNAVPLLEVSGTFFVIRLVSLLTTRLLLARRSKREATIHVFR